MMLPVKYAWLADEPGPRILREFISVHGTAEKLGAGSNPSIMEWAKATGLSRFYSDDSVPWCGLAMAYVALQAGWEPPLNPLWARNWLNFGKPSPDFPMLGDVLVFARGSAGHVGVYVGEDAAAYHIIGGNQSDKVNITRRAKTGLLGSRRCPWRVNQPVNVRRIHLAAVGTLSTNEA